MTIEAIIPICLETESKNPIAIFRELAALPFCHIHGPEHHILVGASLLTAYKNAGGDIELEPVLMEMIKRGKEVPGMACGLWGACGAGISSGIFISIITKSGPLTQKPMGLSNLMTSKSLAKIGTIGGPRCCKRDSFLSILSAIDFVKEHFGIEVEKEDIHCSYSPQNSQCIKTRCPFYSL